MPSPFVDPELLKACIHCGMCLPACPTYRVTGNEVESPRGRLYLMKNLAEGKLTSDQVSPHLDACLGCQACETACPSGVQYGSLLFEAREHLLPIQPESRRRLRRAIFKNVLPNRRLLDFAGKALRLYQRSGLQSVARKSGVLKLLNLDWQEALMPEIPDARSLNPGLSFGNPEHPRVALMTGCMMETFYTPVHWATINVLVANGYYVVIPEQTCCGALAHHAGETDIAQDLAKSNISTVLKLNPEWIVLNSAGCGAVMQTYDQVVSNQPEWEARAKEFSKKVIDVMALLAKKPLVTLSRPFGPPSPLKGEGKVVKATYHAACHLYHAQRVRTEPLEVLQQLPGIEWIPLQDAELCCGSAGIYNIEQPDLSQAILAEKTANLKATGADLVVTGNPGCLLQITHGLKQEGIAMEILHPIELIARYLHNP